MHSLSAFFSLRFLTPLHVASEKAHNDVVEIVVKHEAKVYYLFGNLWQSSELFFCLSDEILDSLKYLP